MLQKLQIGRIRDVWMLEQALAYVARSTKPMGVDRKWTDDDRRWCPGLVMRNRPPHAPNAFYHVTLRGNRQQPIFLDVRDRDRWQRLLAEALVRYGARLHLYCWMTNHIHMVLECGITPICKTLHWVAGAYARTFNAKYAYVGHLFQDRYGSRLVDSDAYLLQLIRYIHLNPVAGGIVLDPLAYPWSSHGRYVLGDEGEWLTTAFVLSLFHPDTSVARRRMAAFTGASETGDRHDDVILFSHGTQTAPSTTRVSNLAMLVATACREFGVEEAMLIGPSHCRVVVRARAWVARAALRQGLATLADVARHLKRSPSTVSRCIAQYRREFEDASQRP